MVETGLSSPRTAWRGRLDGAKSLLLVAGVALAVRWWLVLAARPTCDPPLTGEGDCFRIAGLGAWYHVQADLLGDGEVFAHSFQYLENGDVVDSALHPPAYSTFLGFFSAFGLDTATQHRLLSGLLGVLAVVLVAVLARRLAGPRAGLIAGLVGAVYPMLWINDGMLQVESMVAPVVAGILLAAYWYRDDPSPGRLAVLGALIGLGALTRPELALFALVLLVPLAWRRWREIAVGLGAALLVVAPWIGFNLIRFDRPVLLTNSTGSVMAESTCDSTYYGEFIGYQANCHPDFPLPAAFDGNEAEREAQLLDQADDYFADHLGRWPLVAATRIGRVWDVFNPRQNADLNGWYEGRGDEASVAGLIAYYLLLVPAVYGAVVLYRRRITLLPFLATVIVVTAAAALTFGLTRYRVPAEVSIVVLAGIGADAWWSERMDRRRGIEGGGQDPEVGDVVGEDPVPTA